VIHILTVNIYTTTKEVIVGTGVQKMNEQRTMNENIYENEKK